MNRAVRHPVGRIRGLSVSQARRVLLVSLSALIVGTAGCDGGGGPSGTGSSPPVAPAPTPPPTGTKPAGRGALVVTVVDALGAPLAGADVWINSDWPDEDKYAVTDGVGQAEITGVVADDVVVGAWNDESVGWLARVTVTADAVRQARVVTVPGYGATGGIAAASVPAGGVRDEGRELEFVLSIVQVPDPWYGEYWAWGADAVRVVACVADPANDAPRFQPDCVSAHDGFDASYDGVNNGRAVAIRRVVAQGLDPTFPPVLSTALLLDQSSGIAVADPADKRLFAAKYLLAKAGSGYGVALAAFAADEPASGQSALLPQQPVTIFPVENPQFTSDGRGLFPEVDSLAALEGGGGPLLAAIDRMLDFAVPGARLVVVTDGRDDTCGTRAQCSAQLAAVLQKSLAKGVGIVTVGVSASAGEVDQEMLARLAQSDAGGAMFWAWDPRQLAQVLGTVHRYQHDDADSLRATFRVRSTDVGTFAPGRTVLGRVSLNFCPFECVAMVIPFAVRIP